MIERILLASDGRGAGAVAVSSRTSSRLRHAFIRSVSRGVVVRAGLPVRVVREPGSRV